MDFLPSLFIVFQGVGIARVHHIIAELAPKGCSRLAFSELILLGIDSEVEMG